MVLLTVTPTISKALSRSPATIVEDANDKLDEDRTATSVNEPPLSEPEVGKPISHGQILGLWKRLKNDGHPGASLEQLLKGAQVYVPPPPPKQEPSKEYLALMARLRRDEEQRAYERMVNPPPPLQTFAQLYPNAAHASFAEANRPHTKDDLGDDETTYNDVHRQLMLLINFLVSIAGVAGTLWMAARWWATPARLFLTLGGSIVVAIAEVVVYQVYVWRMGEAKGGQERRKEVREVVKTWVVGEDGIKEKAIGEAAKGDQADDSVLLEDKKVKKDGDVRRRIPVEVANEGV